jgi:hypothetical protein
MLTGTASAPYTGPKVVRAEPEAWDQTWMTPAESREATIPWWEAARKVRQWMAA